MLAKDYKDGKMVSTAGSWEAGVGGALPGIVMPAAPKVGAAYRQEFLAGEAEDMMKVIALGKALTVPAGTFDKVLMTRDWTPLDPEVIEEKAYAPDGVERTRSPAATGSSSLVQFEPGS